MARRLTPFAFALALTFGVPAAADAATRGGTLVFARALDSQFLDPTQTAQNADIWLSLNLYDTLLLASADGTGTEPGLATGYATSDGGKTLTFTMRPGIKFADGSPIQPSDVKWCVGRPPAHADGGGIELMGAGPAGKIGAGHGARLGERAADQLPGAVPVEAHAALGGVHGLGDHQAEPPKVAAEGKRRLPIDCRGLPRIGGGDGIGDDVGGGVNRPHSAAAVPQRVRRGGASAIAFDRSVKAGQEQGCHGRLGRGG